MASKYVSNKSHLLESFSHFPFVEFASQAVGVKVKDFSQAEGSLLDPINYTLRLSLTS